MSDTDSVDLVQDKAEEQAQPETPTAPASARLDANVLSQPLGTQFLRGPLRYDVEASCPQLEAGKSFSVFVRVTNPYESPVTLLGLSVSLPTEFRDKDNQDAGVFATFRNEFKQELKSRVVEASNVVPTSNETDMQATGDIVLQHGNSSLKKFTFKTWKSTLFTPAVYILQFQVQYKIDGVTNQDTIRQELNIHAPLKAVLWGAIWGAIVGSLLHYFYGLTGASGIPIARTYEGLILQTFSSILLGGVLVVAFARKKDAQPFISIEDFYGGFFIGFSAGYLGQALLNRFLP